MRVHFVIRKVSVLSGYNLTHYFERFGFLRIKSFKLGDYGLHTYHLTQEQLDRFRREMNGMTKRKKLKPMPDGMVERIAHLQLSHSAPCDVMVVSFHYHLR